MPPPPPLTSFSLINCKSKWDFHPIIKNPNQNKTITCVTSVTPNNSLQISSFNRRSQITLAPNVITNNTDKNGTFPSKLNAVRLSGCLC